MDLGLGGKTALITGGASGLGKETAATMAAEGVRVMIADLRDDARRVLDRTYPNSEIVRNKGPKSNDPWWKIW